MGVVVAILCFKIGKRKLKEKLKEIVRKERGMIAEGRKRRSWNHLRNRISIRMNNVLTYPYWSVTCGHFTYFYDVLLQ